MQGCLEEYSGLYFQSQGPQHTHACTHGRVRTHLNLCVQDTHIGGDEPVSNSVGFCPLCQLMLAGLIWWCSR